MVDVYLLGLFVAYVKLQPLVRIELGPAFYALCALMITMIAAAALTDPEAIWEELDRRGVKLLRPDPPDEAAGRPLALIGCHVCGQVSWVPDAPRTICPRCATPLHRRKRHVDRALLGARDRLGDPLHPRQRVPDPDPHPARLGRVRAPSSAA